MAITINEIANGIALRVDGQIYTVSEFHHVKPGKGSAFVRVKLKNLKTDAVLERTFRTADKLDAVELEEKELEFLYRDGGHFHFMDHTTYEEVILDEGRLGDVPRFLLENLTVTGFALDNTVQRVVLPNFIVTEITETEPGIRGDSTKAGTKPATIPNGTVIQVPLFIAVGNRVKIDTRSGAYVERV